VSPRSSNSPTRLEEFPQDLVCPAKCRPTSGCESRPGKPPEDPGSQPPASGETRASKRGEAKLQAVANANSAASKVETRKGSSGPSPAGLGEGSSPRPWFWSTSEPLRRMGDGSSEGRSMNWGDPHAPGGVVDHRGSLPVYKATPKSRAVRRESERVVVPMIAETTQLGVGKDPHFGGARAARDGRGHG
jgi:hypothetical protein